MTLMLFELTLEALEQGEGIGGGPGKTGQYLTLVEPTHLARIALHHGRTERDLTIAADHDPVAASYREDCRTTKIFH
jgi:hypothetical protein